jgi:hypothetical protein
VIYVCEGPKVAEAVMADCKVIATANMGGAERWLNADDCDRDLLAGFHVVILADNDEPGQRHAEMVARDLYRRSARSIKIVTLSWKVGGDYIDWAKHQHNTSEEFHRKVYETLEWEPPQDLLDEVKADLGFEDAVERLRELGCDPTITDDATGKGYAKCPCKGNHTHGDSSPSLSFLRGTKTQPFTAMCHRGCGWLEIDAALRGLPPLPELPPDCGKPLDAENNRVWLSSPPIPHEITHKAINRCLFDFARTLKRHFDLYKDTLFLSRLVRRWRELAIEQLDSHPAFEIRGLWREFGLCFQKVRHAGTAGDASWLKSVMARADAAPMPPEALLLYPDEPAYQKLIRLCKQLESDKINGIWFLTGADAGRYLGVSQWWAGQMLKKLVELGVLFHETDESKLPKNRRGLHKRTKHYRYVAAESVGQALAS